MALSRLVIQMSEYRAVWSYCTSGGATVELSTEWVPHLDMVEELIDELAPYEIGRGHIADVTIEEKSRYGGFEDGDG